MPEEKSRINWSEVHERLVRARARLTREFTPDDAERRRILVARARELARASVAPEVDEPLEVLEFSLAQEHYAVETTFVREVSPLGPFTPVPCTPPFVLGLISVRGQVISVVDLRRFFGLLPGEPTDTSKAVILRSSALEFAALADEVIGVRRLARAAIQAPPPTLTGAGAEYLRGVTTDRLMVLGADKILSDPRLVVREEVE